MIFEFNLKRCYAWAYFFTSEVDNIPFSLEYVKVPWLLVEKQDFQRVCVS